MGVQSCLLLLVSLDHNVMQHIQFMGVQSCLLLLVSLDFLGNSYWAQTVMNFSGTLSKSKAKQFIR